MNAANIAFMNVGGKRYAIDLLNPIEAIGWGNRALALFGPSLGKVVNSIDFESVQGIDLATMGLADVAAKLQQLVGIALTSCGEMKSDDVTAIMTQAIERCYTPQNESLADKAVFNRWFRQHPGDLYPLGTMALVYLVKDFFPSQLVTAAGKLQGAQTAETATATTA